MLSYQFSPFICIWLPLITSMFMWCGLPYNSSNGLTLSLALGATLILNIAIGSSSDHFRWVSWQILANCFFNVWFISFTWPLDHSLQFVGRSHLKCKTFATPWTISNTKWGPLSEESPSISWIGGLFLSKESLQLLWLCWFNKERPLAIWWKYPLSPTDIDGILFWVLLKSLFASILWGFIPLFVSPGGGFSWIFGLFAQHTGHLHTIRSWLPGLVMLLLPPLTGTLSILYWFCHAVWLLVFSNSLTPESLPLQSPLFAHAWKVGRFFPYLAVLEPGLTSGPFWCNQILYDTQQSILIHSPALLYLHKGVLPLVKNLESRSDRTPPFLEILAAVSSLWGQLVGTWLLSTQDPTLSGLGKYQIPNTVIPVRLFPVGLFEAFFWDTRYPAIAK